MIVYKKNLYHAPGWTNIIQNKRAIAEYGIEQEIEAGIALQGWEVKALRAGKANISTSYVVMKQREAYLLGANVQPISLTSVDLVCEPTRTRKLLLNTREINFLLSRVNRAGYTIIVLSLYWKHAWVKARLGVAKGKKKYDRRAEIKERQWQLDKARIMKNIGR